MKYIHKKHGIFPTNIGEFEKNVIFKMSVCNIRNMSYSS